RKATTEGVVRAPSAFSITFGFLPSMIATHEFVVPRSMPIILLIAVSFAPDWRTGVTRAFLEAPFFSLRPRFDTSPVGGPLYAARMRSAGRPTKESPASLAHMGESAASGKRRI